MRSAIFQLIDDFTLITTYGLVHNAYWGDVQKEVTAEDLFRE